MVKKAQKLPNDPQSAERIAQFRQEISEEIEQEIEGHEFKMVYIGIATLAVFAAVIYLAWKF
jgi:hypothetical protein